MAVRFLSESLVEGDRLVIKQQTLFSKRKKKRSKPSSLNNNLNSKQYAGMFELNWKLQRTKHSDMHVAHVMTQLRLT